MEPLREPPQPFAPAETTLADGTGLYRVYRNDFTATAFNPGKGGRTRFAFFGDPVVPVLYAAASQEAAVSETILHDVPVEGGEVLYDDYATRVMALIRTSRQLRIAALHGMGLRKVRATAAEISHSSASAYPQTVKWAEAAHRAGFDGMAYMSRQCNDALAYVFFGTRCDDAFVQDPSFGRVFATGPDQDWLIDTCAPLHVDVLPA